MTTIHKVTDECDPLVDSFERTIPRFQLSASKGSYGRVAVIGGSASYTGAPYFASIASLHAGSDLVYVFTSIHASQVIKSYSPELIVYPNLEDPTFGDLFIDRVGAFSSVVIGPGLGRPGDVLSVDLFSHLITKLKERKFPIVLDADSFSYLAKNPSVINGYREAVMTPNFREFKRLYAAVNGKELAINESVDEEIINELKSLAQKLGNVTICLKHWNDKITDGNHVVTYGGSGSPKRCGGQGDLLSGFLGTFIYWTQNSYKSKEDKQSAELPPSKVPTLPLPNVNNNQTGSKLVSPTILAALGASMLTRRCARFAFEKHSRATVTTNMIGEISRAFNALFPKANQYKD